jgi:Rps23 Pro-64 3,4-dihydroxylase Tpa1-like proline 4-hydroxylase
MTHGERILDSTLPIEIKQGLSLDIEQARMYGAQFSKQYQNADPFPHIIIDKFLPDKIIKLICDELAQQKKEIIGFEDKLLQYKKVSIDPYGCQDFTKAMFLFFNSAPFLQVLEELTGIRGLIPDPYFGGGGFHKIYKGGRLGIHTDFRAHPTLRLQRRLNVLLYLNEGWESAWGGALELWDKQMKCKVQEIQPLLNRCVVFNTDESSFHGHPEPLTCPESVSRKSIALYYYTAFDREGENSVNLSTMFRARPMDNGRSKVSIFLSRIRQYAKLQNILPPIIYMGIRHLKHYTKK